MKNKNGAIELKTMYMPHMKQHYYKRIFKNYQLYLFLLPTIIYFLIFEYGPMYGVIIAFKNFRPHLGILGSPWLGFDHFERFFASPQFLRLITNTLGLSIYQLAAGFPIPILLALALNYAQSQKLKRVVQTVTYAPNFISTVVIVGMIAIFFSPRSGLVNHALTLLGVNPIFFLGRPEWFSTLYVWSGVWQGAGWGSIIYLAALSGVNPSLHEAAVVDGATKLQRIRHIDLPGIAPTITILLILNLGGMMSIGFEKVFLMQNALNVSASEVISTYVYKSGLLGAQWSFASAVGLFNTLINFTLLVIVNRIAKYLSETSLW